MWRRWRGYVQLVRLVRLKWPVPYVGNAGRVFSYPSGPTSEGGQGGYDVRVESPRPGWAEVLLEAIESLGGAPGDDGEAVEAGEVVVSGALECRGEAPQDQMHHPPP